MWQRRSSGGTYCMESRLRKVKSVRRVSVSRPALPVPGLEESAGHEAVLSYLVGLARCFLLRGLGVG